MLQVNFYKHNTSASATNKLGLSVAAMITLKAKLDIIAILTILCGRMSVLKCQKQVSKEKALFHL